MRHPTEKRRQNFKLDAPGAARQAGVTLVELAVVMILIAVLLAIGIPSYRSVTTSNRMAAEMDALEGDLQYARAEAVREGRSVTVCIADGSADTSCAPTGTDTWQNGWMVFTDILSNQTYDTNNGDVLLRATAGFTHGDAFQSSGNVNAITFNRDGFTYLTGAANNGVVTITLTNPTDDSAYTRCLELSESGMISTTMYNPTAGCT